MTAIAALGALVAALLLPLLVSVLRTPSLGSMAVRNLRRRRGEAVLVVAGSLLGTAIITASFVVGDIIDGSITDVARTQLGPVDVVLSPADPGDLDLVVAEVDRAAITEVADVFPAERATVALEAGQDGPGVPRATPSVPLLEIDADAARTFGGDPAITGLDGVRAGVLDDGGLLLNERTADRLEVGVGDRVRIHAYGGTRDLEVTAVVEELGLAGFAGGLVAPGTFASLITSSSVVAAPPESLALVSLTGGVFDTRDLADTAVTDLGVAVAGVPGVVIEPIKASLLNDAERDGATFAELFSTIGAFSVLAGVLLLVNLFVMLAEERKTELGMLRALGFTRRRLTQAFALEGALYATVAAALGTLVGIGVGWVVARFAALIFGLADQGLTFRLVIDPSSLALGGLLGLTMALVTIWLTSARIARLNVIRAIRDLPEPQQRTVRPRTLARGALGVLLGAGLTTVGVTAEAAIPLVVGVPVAAFAATPLVRRRLPERPARLLSAGLVVAWGVTVFRLFPDVLGQAELPVFVAQGVVLVAGAVSLASSLDVVWVRLAEALSARGRGLATRLGVAYPLARRFRTSMLLSMFSLVVFTMTFIASMSAMFSVQADAFTTEASGGFDLLVDSNRSNPVTTEQLQDVEGVTTVAGLSRTFARFDAAIVDEPRGSMLTGFDEALVTGGPPVLTARAAAFASDETAYRAVLADPTLTIVSDTFLQLGGPTSDRIRVGDTVAVLDPVTAAPRELTVAGVTGMDWLFTGALVSRTVTAELFGPHDVIARHYLAVAPGTDADAVAATLDLMLLGNGADAATFVGLVTEGLRQENALLTLLQAFLAHGLLVGIAGLGVVMIRAVRERRQEIGMLRAMGARTGLVRATFLSEAGLIALQGSVIGAVLGLVTARQVFVSTDVFGAMAAGFAIPWSGLAVIVLLPVTASLAATAWPAARAAAVRPAVALRVAD